MSTINAITAGAGGVALSGDTSGNVQIQSAGSNSAVFNAYGIGLGNTAPTSGLGIAFPATQSMSSDANTLDDYEEGTWTVTDGSGAGLSFSTSTGTYTKIGSMVYFAFDITYPSTASGAAAKVLLPFTIAGAPTGGASGALGGAFITYTGSNQVITGGYLLAGTAGMIYYTSAGPTVSNANLSTKEFSVAGFYKSTS
jgi:hypothetical protein